MNQVTPDDEFFARLMAADDATVVAASAAVNDFIRTKMREDSFFRRIMPPAAIDYIDVSFVTTPADKPNPLYEMWKDATAEQLVETLSLIEQILADRKRRIQRIADLCTIDTPMPVRPKRRIQRLVRLRLI